MITAAAARLDLKSRGISVSDAVLAAAIEEVEAREDAMFTAGYSEARMVLVQTLAVALIASTGEARQVVSERAPSGAARTFKYPEAGFSSMRRLLAFWDTAGTVTDLVGPDPVTNTLLLVV